MSLFKDLGTEGMEKTQDRVGGFQVADTAIYLATIKMAYAGKSEGGALCVNFIFEGITGGDYKETIYVSNRKGENWFLNQNDKTKKVPLPGFTTVNDICLVTTGQPLSAQAVEEKMVNIWDKDAGKELPKAADVLVDLIGKQVYLGVQKNLENKSAKDGQGGYVDIAETRETNSIEKVFHHPSKMTVVEATNEAEEATFFDKWAAANEGKVRDKRSIKDGDGASTGRPGAAPKGPPAAGAAAPKTKSLFG
jgi:hypothetical protein